MHNCIIVLLLLTLIPSTSLALGPSTAHFSTFENGAGPSYDEGLYHILDDRSSPGQSNAVAFDMEQEGPFERLVLHCEIRVLEGGDGGAFLFLNTTEYGKRGPAPFVKSWVEPNLSGTFAVGIDVHDPPGDESTGSSGNYLGLPEREVSLHWDGREITKRIAPVEFRNVFAECEISLRYVIGGAEVTVRLAGSTVYDGYFVAGMRSYESRLAIGAGTRDDISTEFDVQNLLFTAIDPASTSRRPQHFEIFNHVLTGSDATANIREVTLPPLDWAYGRVILTLEIHDAGEYWNNWDRNGSLFVVDADGEKYDIAPFITSFRTPCRWQVDVTHFRSWLAGKVKFEIATVIATDENKGFMMSASLDFYHGTPEVEPYRVVPVWAGIARYKSADNHFSDFFTPQEVNIDAATQEARLFITTTGHSKVGEFTPSWRTVILSVVKGKATTAEQRFVNLLWKSDSYLNPNRPQHGTWQYSRAGWAPGDVVRPWWIDLTPYIVPGNTAELRYVPEPYDFSIVPEDQRPTDDQINQAVQVVRAYLILYRAARELIPEPFLKVLNVVDDSNAAKAGLEVNDYLISYDGQHPQTIDALRKVIREAEAEGKKRIVIVIYRDQQQFEKILGPGQIGVILEEQ